MTSATPQNDHSPPSVPAMVFDVDGVLVESPHEQAWQESLARLFEGDWRDIAGATSYAPGRFTTGVYQQVVAGKPRMSGALAVLEYFAVPDAPLRAVDYAQRKQRQIEELIAAGAFAAFGDALRFVTALRARGVRLAAASSSKNANTMMAQVELTAAGQSGTTGRTPDRSARMLLDAFDANVCGRDVARGKPFPDLFLLAAGELHAQPQACVVVEDAPAGVEAAKAGGMRAIGVARLDDAALLQQAGADLVVTTLDEVSVDALTAGRLERAPAEPGHPSHRKESSWSRT